MKATLLMAGAAGLFAASAACAADSGPIVIGVPVGLSGANSVVAPSVVQAARTRGRRDQRGRRRSRAQARSSKSPTTPPARPARRRPFDALIFQKKVDVAHFDGDERGAQRRPSRVSKGQHALHLHLVLRRAFLQQDTSTWTPGCPSSRCPRSSTTSRRSKAPRPFPDRQRLRVRPRHARLHPQLHREEGRQGRGRRIPADGRHRLDAIISKLKSAKPDAMITSTAGGAPNVTLDRSSMRAAGIEAALRQSRGRRGHGQEHGRRRRRHLLSASFSRTSTRRRTRSSWRRRTRSSAPISRRRTTCRCPNMRPSISTRRRSRRRAPTEAAKVLEALPTSPSPGPAARSR